MTAQRFLNWSRSTVHRHAVRVVCAGNLLLYLCYFLHLKADFPNGSPWNDFAKFTDEGWYGGAALHRLQTGHWYIANGFNPAVALPAWPVLLGRWFALVGGPGIVAARVLTLLLFGGSLVLLFVLLRPLGGALAAALTVTLVLVNPYSFSFDRLALLEPPMVFLFLLGLWFATVPRRAIPDEFPPGSIGRAAVVGFLLTAAILTKTTAVVLGPALLYQLWATAAGPMPAADGHGRRRLHRLLRHIHTHWRALWLPAIAVSTSLLLWLVYFYGFVRPHYLPDYRHLFAVNAGKAHGRILLQVMARALGDTLWINRILLPLAIIAVAASTRFLRELWRVPLYVSSVLALAATVGFIGWHTWFQPRYYLLCVFPAMIVLALAVRALRERARRLERRSPWRIAHRISLIAIEVAGATMLLQTAQYFLHPRYTLRDTAENMAAAMRADGTQPPVLLSGMGDTVSLFTGVRSVNPEWPIGGLPALLQQEHPGWFAAFTPREQARIAALGRMYTLQPVAEYSVFDEPEHETLHLYRLLPPRK